MRIWHDNSGKNDMGSWFLKYIIVYDLQTKEKFYFLCQKWLAVEKDDGKIERELFVACDKQKTELGYLMQKNVNHQMRDSHLWYSVFTRPVQSSFTRLDRVTCCFVLLYTTMLMSIIYYDASDSNVSSSQFISNRMVIGPFGIKLTVEQVNI